MFQKIKHWLFYNQNETQTVAKNTFWLFTGQMASRGFRAIIVIVAARILGVASWGAFSYALGIATFLTTFSDIGINALITKEASRNPELKDRYVSTAFFIKLFMLVVMAAGVIIFFPYLTNIEEARMIMPILIFVFFFDTLRDLGSAISRAVEHMQIEALVNIFTNFAIVVLGITFLMISGTAYSLAIAYALGSGLGMVVIFYTLGHHFKNIFRKFEYSLIRPVLVTAWPFALLGIMGTINLNTDLIMVGWMKSAEAVGYYSAAQKLIQLLYVFPALLASSIFPTISRLTMDNAQRAKDILEKSVTFVILASIPLVILGLVFANQVVSLVFGAEYLPAVNTFKILMVTLLIVYPSTLIGNAIFAYDKQKSFVPIVLVAIFGNVFFNYIWIPQYGIEGAAFSTVVTQIITNFLIWRRMKQINGFKVWPKVKSWLISFSAY